MAQGLQQTLNTENLYLSVINTHSKLISSPFILVFNNYSNVFSISFTTI